MHFKKLFIRAVVVDQGQHSHSGQWIHLPGSSPGIRRILGWLELGREPMVLPLLMRVTRAAEVKENQTNLLQVLAIGSSWENSAELPRGC